jgi:uncharacterized protein YdeI (YjbR/CyaY-like superfamily)
MNDDPVLPFRNRQAWRSWLARNHAKSTGIWIQIAKKHTGQSSVSHAEALEIALCYGWIDGQRKRGDGDTFLQRFTPRGKRSVWSKINREKALALIANGEMMPAGRCEVERAQADGRWDAAYDSQRSATIPADLAEALASDPAAAAAFQDLDSRNRYAVLHRLQTAKLAATRARRLIKFVEMLARGEKLHP